MSLNGDNITSLAKAMKISRVSLSMKVNGKQNFNAKEISFIVKRYELSNDELVEIFGIGYECY